MYIHILALLAFFYRARQSSRSRYSPISVSSAAVTASTSWSDSHNASRSVGRRYCDFRNSTLIERMLGVPSCFQRTSPFISPEQQLVGVDALTDQRTGIVESWRIGAAPSGWGWWGTRGTPGSFRPSGVGHPAPTQYCREEGPNHPFFVEDTPEAPSSVRRRPGSCSLLGGLPHTDGDTIGAGRAALPNWQLSPLGLDSGYLPFFPPFLTVIFGDFLPACIVRSCASKADLICRPDFPFFMVIPFAIRSSPSARRP